MKLKLYAAKQVAGSNWGLGDMSKANKGENVDAIATVIGTEDYTSKAITHRLATCFNLFSEIEDPEKWMEKAKQLMAENDLLGK